MVIVVMMLMWMWSKMLKHKDYTYHPFERRGEILWGIYVGRTILQSVCRTEKEAQIETELFNKDPYWFERQDWKRYIEKRK